MVPEDFPRNTLTKTNVVRVKFTDQYSIFDCLVFHPEGEQRYECLFWGNVLSSSTFKVYMSLCIYKLTMLCSLPH